MMLGLYWKCNTFQCGWKQFDNAKNCVKVRKNPAISYDKNNGASCNNVGAIKFAKHAINYGDKLQI